MTQRTCLALGLFMLFSLATEAQRLVALESKWDDDFTQWALLTDEEGEEGSLELLWPLQRDWSAWRYRYGSESGQIRLKWRDDPTHWELQSDRGSIVTMRTMWGADANQWRITDNSKALVFQTRYTGRYDEWTLRDKAAGDFGLYTLYEFDPRDWEIVDELDPSIGEPMKMAMVFVALYHAIPKR